MVRWRRSRLSCPAGQAGGNSSPGIPQKTAHSWGHVLLAIVSTAAAHTLGAWALQEPCTMKEGTCWEEPTGTLDPVICLQLPLLTKQN